MVTKETLYEKNALTTIERALQFLGITDEVLDNNTNENELITLPDGTTKIVSIVVYSEENMKLYRDVSQAINKASAAIEIYCGRSFGKNIHEQYLRKVTDEIVTEQYPLHALLCNGQKVTENILYMDKLAGIVELHTPVSGLIEYEAGYILPKDETDDLQRTLPYDIEECCLRLVKKWYVDDDGYLGDMQNLKLGDWGVKLGDDETAHVASLIPPAVQSSLNLHKRMMFYDE